MILAIPSTDVYYKRDKSIFYLEMTLERSPIQFVDIHPPRTREKLDPSKIKASLINMSGNPISPHEAYGLEIIGGRLIRDTGLIPHMYDTQFELAKTGRIDTDKLAERIRKEHNDPNRKGVLGLGMTIDSYEYTRSLLIKLEQDPPESPLTIIVGNAIATYTPPELIHKDFPYVKIVKGEGEEAFSQIVQQIARGEEVKDVTPRELVDLSDYSEPYRFFLRDVIDAGGSVKLRTCEGCKFGNCKFCSRDFRAGKDFRYVPPEYVVTEAEDLINNYNVTRLQLTDEDSFPDGEGTTRFISAWKSRNLRRIEMGASLRVETLNMLKDKNLLDQLQEIGLSKVFLGVEGGSDRFLNQIGKGQRMKEVKEAVKNVKESVWIDPQTNKEHPLEMEMGFIAFSYRMDMQMLRDNVQFLSQVETDPTGQTESSDVTKTYAQYVSSLFNLLEVRAGTLDAGHVRSYVQKANDPTDRNYEKYQVYKDYDPDKNFSINSSTFKNVPFLDPEVGEIYKKAARFSQADESLYYAIKSINRAASLPETLQEIADNYYLQMKGLHLEFLRDAVGLASHPDVAERRKNLIAEMQTAFGDELQGDALDTIRREIKMFFNHEAERQEAKSDQHGVLAVCVDENKRYLLVRAQHDEDWSFPGGNINPGENDTEALTRELQEELGLKKTDISFMSELPTTTKNGHHDATTGPRSQLRLQHFRTQISGPIDLDRADGEIVDVLWIHPDDIKKGKIQIKENVLQTVNYMTETKKYTDKKTIFDRFALFQ